MSGRLPGVAQVFSLRCHFKNGLMLDYTFWDAGRAKSINDQLGVARTNRERLQFVDDAAREADVDCAELMVHQLVDVLSEGMTNQAVVQQLAAAGLLASPSNGAGLERARTEAEHEQPSPPRIGGRPQFAL